MTNASNSLALLGGRPACEQPWPVWPVFDDTERRQLKEVQATVNAVLEQIGMTDLFSGKK